MAAASTGAETIETPLLRVPFESLKRTTRDRKLVVDELSAVLSALQQGLSEASPNNCQQLAALDDVDRRLVTLKRKLGELSDVEAQELHRCRTRLQHLLDIGTPSKNALLEWNRKRLDRLLVDHLLRRGYLKTALQLADESGLQDLVDAHIFVEAQSVVDALKQRDCGPALAWCAQHSAKLKKIKSRVEFKLRLQEFVELVRSQRAAEAIAYARKHLSQWASPYESEHQQTFALLIFPPDTDCSRYVGLFSPARWEDLQTLFRQDLYRLHSLTPTSLLNIHLQAGLSALKVPQSLEEGTNKEDPLHLPTFRQLAAKLPFSKHVHSKLVCAITRQQMNEHNPPMVTPDGAVYSEVGMREVAARNGGQFVDPLSGAKFNMSDMRRAYIS